MLNDRRSSLLIVLLIVLIAIPVTVWLVLNTAQLLDRRAAENEVVINFIPTTIQAQIGGIYTAEVYLNAGSAQISGATISLNQATNGSDHLINSIAFETGNGKPFTDAVYDPTQNPSTFTLLSKRPDSELATGTFKIATITFQATSSETLTISSDITASEIVGISATSDIVNFTVLSTQITVVTTGDLCRIEVCALDSAINLVEQPRNDRKYNVQVSWQSPPINNTTSSPYFYKLYHKVGQQVPSPHVVADLVTTTVQKSFIDTNNSAGFEGLQTVNYDIDTYIACPGNNATPTVPQATHTPTPTPTTVLATATPTGVQ